MKKIAIGLMVIALTVALSLSVMGERLPCGSVEHAVWELIEGGWVNMGTGNLAANARAWSSYPVQGTCNKSSWNVPVKVHASVAQWVEWSLSGSRYDWRVRKPGEYAANSLTASLKSNSDVGVDFDGFANLQYLGAGGVKKDIDTWYAYGDPITPGELNWISAGSVNDLDDLVKDSEALHNGYSWKLWNKIKVTECNSACEYEDDATITLVLMNQKRWIDPQTGNFRGPRPE